MDAPRYTPLWYRQLMEDSEFKRRCLLQKANELDPRLPLSVRINIADYLLDYWLIGMYYQMIELGEM